jgi:hypothetical protein
MSTDFTFEFCPACDLTPERLERLEAVIAVQVDETEDFSSDEEYRQALREAVQSLKDDYRDMMYWEPQGPRTPLRYPIWISGGMSYGEPTTDACEHLRVLSTCKAVWDLLHEWAVADQAGKVK